MWKIHIPQNQYEAVNCLYILTYERNLILFNCTTFSPLPCFSCIYTQYWWIVCPINGKDVYGFYHKSNGKIEVLCSRRSELREGALTSVPNVLKLQRKMYLMNFIKAMLRHVSLIPAIHNVNGFLFCLNFIFKTHQVYIHALV